ncbi:43020_t:CDS:2 [Gigaspora margarita]|uniref:43020_t:CDS:1 n=1 Tax=Gigaspora margarita TaxID=4874 RepID=A0ABN7UM79_GIGMA|nr:43020_t:CDS:2 [Gigaspora margarita]
MSKLATDKIRKLLFASTNNKNLEALLPDLEAMEIKDRWRIKEETSEWRIVIRVAENCYQSKEGRQNASSEGFTNSNKKKKELTPKYLMEINEEIIDIEQDIAQEKIGKSSSPYQI